MIGKTETRRDSIKGKRSRAQKKTLLVLILAVSIGLFCTHWAWKYYGLTDRTCIKENKSVEKRAKAAMDFAKRHNMNEHYVLLGTIAFSLVDHVCLFGTLIKERL